MERLVEWVIPAFIVFGALTSTNCTFKGPSNPASDLDARRFTGCFDGTDFAGVRLELDSVRDEHGHVTDMLAGRLTTGRNDPGELFQTVINGRALDANEAELAGNRTDGELLFVRAILSMPDQDDETRDTMTLQPGNGPPTLPLARCQSP